MKKTLLFIAFLLLQSGILSPGDAQAQVSGVSFSFSPTVEYTVFEGNTALQSGYAFGGSLGMGLGQYLELQATYLLGDGYRTDFSRLQTSDSELRNRLDSIPNRRINMERLGLSTKVNLSSTAFVPYLTAGTGLVRFSRSGLNESDSIYLSGGAGFMLTLASRYSLFAQATHTGYRYNPGSAFLRGSDLVSAQLEPNNFSQQLVTNWHFAGGLKVYLGGSSEAPDSRDVLFLDEFNGGLSNLRWSFDAIYGQIFFNNENLGFRSNTHLTGLQFGGDFGPFAGVRGFYWHGVDATDGVSLDDINAYGAEFRASFFRTTVSPILMLGGGYLNVHSGYRPDSLVRARSQLFSTAGAGIEVDFTNNVSFSGDIRAIMLTQDGVDNSSSPSRIELSPMFTLGVSYRIGEFTYRERRRPDSRITEEPRRFDDRQFEDQQRLLVMREAALSTEIARALAEGDTLTANNLQIQLEQVRESSSRLMARPGQQMVRTPDDRVIMLPVLEEGEINIRFGPPAPQPAPAQPVVVVPQAGGTAVSGSDRDSTIRELERRITELTGERDRERDRVRTASESADRERTDRERALERRIEELEARLEQRRTDGEIEPEVDVESELPAAVGPGELQGVSIHLGLINPFQAILGIRGDYGSVLGDRFELIPELVVGLGGGTRMWNINAITLIPLPEIPYVNITPFSPYAGLGVGIKAFSNPPSSASGIQFVWSFHLGATAEFGPGSLYIEYANQNMFSFNNLAAGYRFRF
ncbi:MAG: hypothetical protein LAT84_06305 [Balneolia bacterium]|nr:hypothetical protein [Balneolia bacterium]